MEYSDSSIFTSFFNHQLKDTFSNTKTHTENILNTLNLHWEELISHELILNQQVVEGLFSS